MIILLRFEAIFVFKAYYQKKEGVTEQKGASLYSSLPPPTFFVHEELVLGLRAFKIPGCSSL